MLLAVDVGNTQTHLGAFSRRRAGRALALPDRRRRDRRRDRRADRRAARAQRDRARRGRRDRRLLRRAAARRRVRGDGATATSTPPACWSGPGIKTGMAIRIDNPYEVGADRLVNAVAAYDRFGGACVVVDFGTGINFDVVSADGEYLGGAIAPGVEISLTALTERGARIPRIDLGEPEAAIGKSTRAAIQSGRDLRLRRADRRDRPPDRGGARRRADADRHRRPRARDRPLLRDDRRGRRPADADRPAA